MKSERLVFSVGIWLVTYQKIGHLEKYFIGFQKKNINILGWLIFRDKNHFEDDIFVIHLTRFLNFDINFEIQRKLLVTHSNHICSLYPDKLD